MAYWLGATRSAVDKKFYYNNNDEVLNVVDIINATLKDDNLNANCLTIEKNDAKVEPEFELQSSKCDEDEAFAICTINVSEYEETKNETTHETDNGADDNVSSNIPGGELPKFPCQSHSSRRKRSSEKESKPVAEDSEPNNNLKDDYQLDCKF